MRIKQALLAVAAFGVWITVIIVRTNAFTELSHDPGRTFAILISAIAAGTFAVAVYRLIDKDD